MTSTLIIAFSMITAVVILILSLKHIQKKGQAKRLIYEQGFISEVVWKNKLELTEKEMINGNFFGIDRVNFMLLYINFQSEKPQVELFSLWEVASARSATSDYDIWEQRRGKPVLTGKELDKMFLTISFSNKPKKLLLPVYQLENGMQDLSVLKQRIAYWEKLINKCIAEIPKKHKHSVQRNSTSLHSI
ncbi:MAG: hypothetical protein ABIT96_05035 [Ferruginibacter sp.]